MAAQIHLSQQHSCSFNHLVGDGKHARWNGDAERLGRLEIDDQIEFGGLHNRQIARLFAPQDSTGIATRFAVCFYEISAIGHESPSKDKLSPLVNCWYGMASRERN